MTNYDLPVQLHIIETPSVLKAKLNLIYFSNITINKT